MKTYPLLLAGEKTETASKAEVRFPYNDEVVAEVWMADAGILESAIQASVAGFAQTRKLPVYKRAEILHKLAGIMEQRHDELVEALILEGGKARKVAEGEAARARETVRVSAEAIKEINGEILTIDTVADGEGRTGFYRRFPMGPVTAIAPFNYPLNLACHKVAPAIAAGNSVILKPASATPLSGLLLGEMIVAAGFPKQAISVVPCPGRLAETLVRDPRIAFFSFTGSSQVGWHLKSVCGRKGAGLELGGNAAVILHEDANLDFAAKRIAMGGFINAGQNCISVQRVLIHRPVFDAAVEKIVAAVKALKVGDPRDAETTIGPMIDARTAAEALEKVNDAKAKGAKLLMGGTCEGTMFHPTIIADTTADMRVRQEEMFAPVITVSVYDTFEQAVEIANQTYFGLQHGVFTRDMGRIMMAFEEVHSGGVIINDVSTFRLDHMPYGGVKDSGMGKEGPRYVIEEMTLPKLMVLNLSA